MAPKFAPAGAAAGASRSSNAEKFLTGGGAVDAAAGAGAGAGGEVRMNGMGAVGCAGAEERNGSPVLVPKFAKQVAPMQDKRN